jgi:DNA-binding NarL/FixJ family response regulator
MVADRQPEVAGRPLRHFVADDHTLVRAGIRSLLERLAGVTVVGEAGDGLATLEGLETAAADILVVDISMPKLNGMETTARALERFPSLRVVVLSMHSNEEYVLQAFRAGASAYLLKESAIAELEVALISVAKGQVYLSPSISRNVIAGYLANPARDGRPLLSPRQVEILKLLAEGRTTKEIALDLGLSVKTVETYRAQVMERLAVHDVPGLVKYAMRIGLIPAEG